MVKFDFDGADINIDSVDPEAPSVSKSSTSSTSGPTIPSTSDTSVASTAPATPPLLSVNADAPDKRATPTNGLNDGQPNLTTAVIEKEVDERKEVGAEGVLEGHGHGNDDDDSYGMDMGYPLHSMFDLPLSPVLSGMDLVPSRLNSPAPETSTPTESPDPSAIVASTSIISPLATSTALSTAAIIALAIATTILPSTLLESQPALLKRKLPLPPVSTNGEESSVAKRPWRGVIAESRNDVPPAVPTKLRKGGKQPFTPTASASAAGEPLTSLHSSAGDAPWFKSAITMLTAEDLGDQWTNVVKMWVLFKRKEIGRTATVLGSLHRPPSVRNWIQRARTATYRPAIASVDSFAISYQLWWASLQPDWRLSASGEVTYEKVEGNWDVIRKPGKNGLLSVAAALFFWGLSVQDAEDTKGWEASLADLLLVLTELLK